MHLIAQLTVTTKVNSHRECEVEPAVTSRLLYAYASRTKNCQFVIAVPITRKPK